MKGVTVMRIFDMKLKGMLGMSNCDRVGIFLGFAVREMQFFLIGVAIKVR